mgnify:CR=1 FL=1
MYLCTSRVFGLKTADCGNICIIYLPLFMKKSDSPTFSVYVPFYCFMANSRNKIIIEFSMLTRLYLGENEIVYKMYGIRIRLRLRKKITIY